MLPISIGFGVVVGALFGFGLNHFFGTEKVTPERIVTLGLYHLAVFIPLQLAIAIIMSIPYLGGVIGPILSIAVMAISSWLGFFGMRDVLKLPVKVIIIFTVVLSLAFVLIFLVPLLMLYIAAR